MLGEGHSTREGARSWGCVYMRRDVECLYDLMMGSVHEFFRQDAQNEKERRWPCIVLRHRYGSTLIVIACYCPFCTSDLSC